MSEELRLQLDVVSNSLTQGLFEARSLAEGRDLEVVEEIRTGAEAERVNELLAEIMAADGTDADNVTTEEWYEASSARIDRLTALLPVVHTGELALARENLDRAERSLWSRSILLGALFILSILVASNAVFATRERGEALAEYGQLTDGLRQWFVAAAFPDEENVEIAARYIPASVRTMSGGDWYDVYRVGPTRGGHWRHRRSRSRCDRANGPSAKHPPRAVNRSDAGTGSTSGPSERNDLRLRHRRHAHLRSSRSCDR
jgi:hypothetical protein